MEASINLAIQAHHSAREIRLRHTLAHYAVPPLDGVITPELLAEHGIELIMQPSSNLEWLTQRGQQIGQKYPIVPPLEVA